jgi:hypothetical protein
MFPGEPQRRCRPTNRRSEGTQTIGLDIAKSAFQGHGVRLMPDRLGRLEVDCWLNRGRLLYWDIGHNIELEVRT